MNGWRPGLQRLPPPLTSFCQRQISAESQFMRELTPALEKTLLETFSFFFRLFLCFLWPLKLRTLDLTHLRSYRSRLDVRISSIMQQTNRPWLYHLFHYWLSNMYLRFPGIFICLPADTSLAAANQHKWAGWIGQKNTQSKFQHCKKYRLPNMFTPLTLIWQSGSCKSKQENSLY